MWLPSSNQLFIALLIAAPVSAADFKKGLATYGRGDYALALREWKPLAEKGNADAQYNLGDMYVEGQELIQNYKQAAKWYRKAAKQGHEHAQHKLGVMYGKGQGVLQDYVKAHMWLNLSASRGIKLAIIARDIITKRMTPADISKAQAMAREWMRKFEARKMK